MPCRCNLLPSCRSINHHRHHMRVTEYSACAFTGFCSVLFWVTCLSRGLWCFCERSQCLITRKWMGTLIRKESVKAKTFYYNLGTEILEQNLSKTAETSQSQFNSIQLVTADPNSNTHKFITRQINIWLDATPTTLPPTDSQHIIHTPLQFIKTQTAYKGSKTTFSLIQAMSYCFQKADIKFNPSSYAKIIRQLVNSCCWLL